MSSLILTKVFLATFEQKEGVVEASGSFLLLCGVTRVGLKEVVGFNYLMVSEMSCIVLSSEEPAF